MGKIGIITWHYYSNFGSVLQAYALQEAIVKLGRDVEFVNYHNLRFGRPHPVKDAVKLLLHSTLGRLSDRFRWERLYFSHKYLRMGKLVTDISLLPQLSKRYAAIVCGSDQIWAPNCYNPIYFAAFSGEGTRKVSYAASIGLTTLPDELVPRYREHLLGFHAVAVREAEGKQLLKEKCGIAATVVLDPTLLHDSSFYLPLERRVAGIAGKYLFCYFLNKEHRYRDCVERYAKRHGLQIVGVSERSDDGAWMKHLTNLSAGQFLWLIHHAEMVVTDSYHGTIFSLLMRKDFRTLVRFAEDSPICQNSRIRQLQEYFGDAIPVLGTDEDIGNDTTIDHDDIARRLEVLRHHSLEYLRNAIEGC